MHPHSLIEIRCFLVFNSFMPIGLCYLNSLDSSISYIRGVWLFFIVTIFVEMSELIANSVHPDQMPRSEASDLGLHCLPMLLLWDARHK